MIEECINKKCNNIVYKKGDFCPECRQTLKRVGLL